MKGRYQPLSSESYVRHRASVATTMENSSVLVMHSADMMPRNGDCFFSYRQDSDFLYLTGIDQEESKFLLFKDMNGELVAKLFIKKTSDLIRIWEGHKYSKEEARGISGIEEVYWEEEFAAVLKEVVSDSKHYYFTENSNDRFRSEVLSANDRHFQLIQDQISHCETHSIAKTIAAFRTIKSEQEIAMMKEAISITKLAYDKVLKSTKPGLMEYEIEGEIIGTFIKNGASGHAYEPIVASGANACVLHYVDNADNCNDGDLLLLDFGAEYGNYAADLSRTIPVNGKFTDRQAQVYQACLNVFKHARSLLVVGNTFKKWQESTIQVMEKELVGLGLYEKEGMKQSNGEGEYRKYFMHGIGHFLGMDVHDVGDRSRVFEAGMVFTCEPGIYIEKEGLGIRIENDILITEGGPVDLMEDFPIEIKEIEAIMGCE